MKTNHWRGTCSKCGSTVQRYDVEPFEPPKGEVVCLNCLTARPTCGKMDSTESKNPALLRG